MLDAEIAVKAAELLNKWADGYETELLEEFVEWFNSRSNYFEVIEFKPPTWPLDPSTWIANPKDKK